MALNAIGIVLERIIPVWRRFVGLPVFDGVSKGFGVRRLFPHLNLIGVALATGFDSHHTMRIDRDVPRLVARVFSHCQGAKAARTVQSVHTQSREVSDLSRCSTTWFIMFAFMHRVRYLKSVQRYKVRFVVGQRRIEVRGGIEWPPGAIESRRNHSFPFDIPIPRWLWPAWQRSVDPRTNRKRWSWIDETLRSGLLRMAFRLATFLASVVLFTKGLEVDTILGWPMVFRPSEFAASIPQVRT